MITLNISKNNIISKDYIINIEQKDILNPEKVSPYNETYDVCSYNFNAFMLPIDLEYLENYNHTHSCHEIMTTGLRQNIINNYLSYYFCLQAISNNEDIFKEKVKKILSAFLVIKEINNIDDLPIVYYQVIGKRFHLIFNFTNNSPYANSCLKLMVMLKLMRYFIKAENIGLYDSLKSLILTHVNADSRKDIVKLNIDKVISIISDFNLLSEYRLKDCHHFFDSLSYIETEIDEIKTKLAIHPPQVLSRHPTHKVLRSMLLPKNTVIRLGTLRNETAQTINPTADKIINSYESVLNSASKVRMKELFIKYGISTAVYCYPKNLEDLNTFLSGFNDKTKFIIKSEFGSRGVGLYLKENKEDVINFFEKSKVNKYGKYIVEKFYNYNLEYRIHVTKDRGYFYACRKMLKTESTERWYRNNSNCVWILEGNKNFNTPDNWEDIISDCQRAIRCIGLDIGACDVRVQSKSQLAIEKSKNNINDKQKFIICEINSAPSFGNFTAEHYKTQIQGLCAD